MRMYKTALAAAAALAIGVGAASAAQYPSKIFDPSYNQFDNEVTAGTTVPIGPAAPTVNAPAQQAAAGYPNLLFYQRCQEALNKGPDGRGDIIAYCNAQDVPAWLN